MEEELVKLLFSLEMNSYLSRDQVSSNTNLLHEMILDSLSLIEYVILLQKEFKVTILPHEITEENFSTLVNIQKFVEDKIRHD